MRKVNSLPEVQKVRVLNRLFDAHWNAGVLPTDSMMKSFLNYTLEEVKEVLTILEK